MSKYIERNISVLTPTCSVEALKSKHVEALDGSDEFMTWSVRIEKIEDRPSFPTDSSQLDVSIWSMSYLRKGTLALIDRECGNNAM